MDKKTPNPFFLFIKCSKGQKSFFKIIIFSLFVLLITVMKKSLTLKSEPNLHSRNNSIFLNHIVSFKIVLRMKNLKLTPYQVPEIQCMLCALIKLNCTCILKFCILLVKVKTWRAALSVTLPYKHSWRSRSAVKCISL